MAAPATGTPTDAAPTDDRRRRLHPLAPLLDLGGRRYDLTHRALVMGILNRTPDSFYDKGATFELDKLYGRAEQLVADGADILDIGGVKAGPGPEVTEPEELERVVPVVAGLVARFDTPVSVDTWRASVARASYAEGAVMGNDISGLADPDYAPAAAEHDAAVVITHIRLAPRVADPEPHYDDVVADVARFLTERADGARRRRHPRRADRARCRPRPRQDGRAVADPAARLGDAGRAGLPAAALGVQQDVPGQDPRSGAHRAARGFHRRGGPRHRLGLPHRARARRQGHLPGPRRARRRQRGASERGEAASPVYLVKGDDAALVAQAVRGLLDDVVGDGDHALIVEEIGGGAGDELNVGAVVDACLTPPFLVDRRVVVVREAGRLLTADVPRLVEVVQDPLPSTVLILVGGGGTVPAPLVKAISAAGQVIDVTTSKAGDRKAWLHDHLRAAPVKLEPRAADLLAGHVGEDLGRVEGLLERAERRLRRGGAGDAPTTWRPISARRATSRATS